MFSKKTTSIAFGVAGLIGIAGASQFAINQSKVTPERERTPVQRDKVDAPDVQPGQRGGTLPADFPVEFRTIDGSFNNGANPLWGAVGTPLIRILPNDYGDGMGTPAGADRPSARAVSAAVHAQDNVDHPNPLNLSDHVWQWGQFLDHDITETPIPSDGEAFDIPVPKGDPWFDPKNSGDMVIPLGRSAFITVDGVRQQVNNITAFVDASNVYGSEEERAEALRTLDGTGKLKTSAGGELMPYNTDGYHNAPDDNDTSMFLGGDIRANEQAGLAAMHTLFVLEHNRLAEQIASENPGMSGDEIFERARAFVAAEMQAITYNEFLPLLIGGYSIPEYTGYDPTVNPTISNVFAHAAFRVGHTMLSGQIMRLDASNNEIPAGHLDLAQAFFEPSLLETEGIASILRGLARQEAQDVDNFIIGDVRNFLFGPPGAGGFDLAALNIQRGREHGLASYNDYREAYGRARVTTFAEVNPNDPSIGTRLASVYDDVDQIDPWTGFLCEPPAQGAYVGETLRRILADQFIRLRDGDRFWYESYLPPDMVAEVEKMTLAEVIRANTDIDDEIQNNVFVMPSSVCLGDCNGDGNVDFSDLTAILFQFDNADPACDADQSGTVDFNDIVSALFMFGECQ
jgi:hypothetical protein